MKMLCTLLIALLCALGLTACGNNAADAPDNQQNQTEPDTNAPDTDTNVPPEGNVNSQGPDGAADDGNTVTGDLENAADDVGDAVGGAMDDMGDAAKDAGKAVSDKENP